MEPTFHIGQLIRPDKMTSGAGDQHTYCAIDIVPRGIGGSRCYRVKTMNGIERAVRPHNVKEASADVLSQ